MEKVDTKIQDKKTLVIIIITFLLVIITVVISTIVVFNMSNKKQDEVKQEVQPEFYYCYREKEKDIICGEVPCKYTSYYKFKIINTDVDLDAVNQHVEGNYIVKYQFSEDNFDKAQPTDFISKDAKYKIDAQNLTYYVSKEMIIQPTGDVEFNKENEINYLYTQGFYECEAKNE